MSEKTQFPKGLFFKKPSELPYTPPEFVKGQLSIKVDEFKEWLSDKSGYVNIDLVTSKNKPEKLYLSYYEKNMTQHQGDNQSPSNGDDEVSPKDIPF